VLTSNPEGPQVQQARTARGRTVAGEMLAGIAERNRGAEPLGSVGAVVGATIGRSDENFDVNGPLLVPGIGAQGGTADDVRRIFAGVLHQVLPSTSREVLGAGPERSALAGKVREVASRFADLVG
jgi:orotidine-5'-phosphate decarboxylase